MSLNRRQQAATRDELAANLELAGVKPTDVAAALGLAEGRVEAALAVIEARPQDVWLVRDYLDRVIRSHGSTPRPYTSLSENMRAAAHAWFALVDVDQAMKEATR